MHKVLQPHKPSPGWPSLHQGPKPLLRLATKLGRSSQQKRTTQILIVNFNGALMKLCVCDKKIKSAGFLSHLLVLQLKMDTY